LIAAVGMVLCFVWLAWDAFDGVGGYRAVDPRLDDVAKPYEYIPAGGFCTAYADHRHNLDWRNCTACMACQQDVPEIKEFLYDAEHLDERETRTKREVLAS
jgi:hypothetical protein